MKPFEADIGADNSGTAQVRSTALLRSAEYIQCLSYSGLHLLNRATCLALLHLHILIMILLEELETKFDISEKEKEREGVSRVRCLACDMNIQMLIYFFCVSEKRCLRTRLGEYLDAYRGRLTVKSPILSKYHLSIPFAPGHRPVIPHHPAQHRRLPSPSPHPTMPPLRPSYQHGHLRLRPRRHR